MLPSEVSPSPPSATTLVLPIAARSTADRGAPAESDGSAPPLQIVTDAARRSRLAAASVCLIAALSVATLWAVLHHHDVVAWPLDLTFIVALIAVFALLAGTRPLSAVWLRRLEIAIFGSTAALLAFDLYYSGGVWGEWGVPGGLASAVKNMLIATIMLIFTYAMLIPNPPRVAARLIVAMACLPFLTQLLLYALNPKVMRVAQQAYVAMPSAAIENLMLMSMAVALAIYGTHVLNVLRREAHEARQLNQYQLGRRLGWGGMGEVFLAEHRFLRRPCAVKLIRAENAGDPAALARFEREVRSMAKLSHPNIVDIYDYGHTEDGTFYYVMEYLNGMSLEALVEKHGPQPPGRVVFLLRQVCDALEEAHEAGLIHRDLKPSNIFITRRGSRPGVVKLIDFGLVKTLEPDPANDQLSREGRARGTPQWMAPEQATGSPAIDSRCDLYALGGVAYFLLTGQPPFTGESFLALMIAHVRDPVRPPSELRPEIPADLEAVVLRCLAKDPDDRYPDAASLRRDLLDCRCSRDWGILQTRQWWSTHQANDPAGASWPTR